MIAALRSEWIKFSTLTSSWVMVAIAAAFPIVIVALTGGLADGTFSDGDVAELVAGTGVVSALLLGTLGVLTVTSEFGHNTIRPAFAALPDRWRVLLAKPALQVGVSAAVMIVVVVVGWVLGRALTGDDAGFSDGDGVGAVLIGVVVLAVLLTLFGYALGLLVRNTALAICVLLLWPLLVEGLLAGLFAAAGWDGLQKWLPYQAAFQMINRFPDDNDSLGRVGGGAWFAVWIALLLGLGIWRTHRRDA